MSPSVSGTVIGRQLQSIGRDTGALLSSTIYGARAERNFRFRTPKAGAWLPQEAVLSIRNPFPLRPASASVESMSVEEIFLDFSARKLNLLASRVLDCLSRLNDDQVWFRGGENQNAVGNLVLHLCGNVRQWMISRVAGADDVRKRDAEFAARGGLPVEELRLLLRRTVDEAVSIITNLPAERLTESIAVQGYEVTVLEAVYTVIEHFAQHTGQIIFATKILTGEDLGYYAHLKTPDHRQKTP